MRVTGGVSLPSVSPSARHLDPTASVVISTAIVTVAATTVWAGPDLTRDVDAPMVGPDADLAAWLTAMDAQTDPQRGRLGLHGRVLTQLLLGVGLTDLRLDAVAPAAAGPRPEPLGDATDKHEHPGLGLAREHLGLRYLWGGLTPLGLDCSGLVHHTWRRLGGVVPRDAYAQAEACEPVELGAERSGDLYFFARPGARIHHVGIVVSPGRMVHASETGGVVEEELAPDRRETLVAAGRLSTP